jgi:NADH:ubiquinone oxidoreductase subunit 5 (subunit L)/multisubunit Na+/H+ antiporter MnhA subunit
MEGPTPVSALIHAATMVTAGIFLIVRCSVLFQTANEELSLLMVFFGVFTALFSAMVGLFQNDVKKVIAYSTCSQLGYMFFICGFSQYILSFYHVITHAFFKALLFLTAGAILHVLNDEQDIRKMGKLKNLYPFYGLLFLLGSLALTGIPFLSGFYSKDLILEAVFSFFIFKGLVGYFFGVVAALFSALYSVKLMSIVFFSHNKSNKFNFYNLSKVPSIVLFPLTFLVLAAIFFGYLLSELFIGVGTDIFQNTVVEQFIIIYDNEMLSSTFKNLPLVFTLFGFFLATILCFLNSYLQKFAKVDNINFLNFHSYFKYLTFCKFFIIKGGFDALLSVLTRHTLREGYILCFALIDKLLLEKFGPYGVVKVVFQLSRLTVLNQTGSLVHYFSFMLLFLFAILIVATVTGGFIFM